MIIVAVLMFAALVIATWVFSQTIGVMSALFVFLSVQLLMAVGTIGYLSPYNSYDRLHWVVICLSYFTFWAGSVLFSLISASSMDETGKAEDQVRRITVIKPDRSIILLTLLSIAVSLRRSGLAQVKLYSRALQDSD